VLAAVILAPAPAGADPSASTLDGLGFGLTGTLATPLGQTVESQLPTVTFGSSAPQATLPQLSVGETPPSAGSPSSPTAQPSSSPAGQDASRPREERSGPRATPAQQSGGDTTSRSGRGSSRGSSAAGRGGRVDAGTDTAASSDANRGAQERADASGRRKPSIATRIVDRVPAEYRRGLLALAAIAVLFGLLSLYEARRSRRAREDALVDTLTGLANREGFEQRVDSEWKRAARYERDLGLLMLDLDGFKEINDTQGHIAGDRILREAAAAISGRIRETDFAARFGGDEFVVLCPETADRGLMALSDDLEETLRRNRIEASVGFTQREPSDSSPQDLVARADAAMYRQKRESTAHAKTLATADV
jgi:diguanylate cyclase (GGDEF)-like protein